MKVQNTLTTGTSRRVFTAGALSVAAALALSACGGAAATAPATATAKPDLKAAGAGTITMWVDAERSPALKDITAKFQADTGIEVKLVVKDFAAVRDDFITQVPTGKGPDLIVGPHDWVGKFVQNGVIAPVELGDKKAGFQDSSVKAMTFNGSVYGVPYAIENIALLRNTDMVPAAAKTFDEVMAGPEIIFGSSGLTAGNYHQGAIMRNIFGAKIKHVLGYPGAAELLVAVARGDLHGDGISWSSIAPDLTSSGKVVPCVRFSEATAPGMPTVPYILDKARNQEERQIINMAAIFTDIARPFVAGSKVPPERLGILREAFNRTVKDPGFIAEVARARRDIIDPMTGEEVEKQIAELYVTPKAVISKFANAIE